ncbi:hypothetical protein LWI29_021312 [Acer saccharum]|uniref:Uncharacterized protein n=1 Tax=Acer saccharum TaxID=4024 RepID=A0AA39VNY3_ACESA|nr:hypothetical protein LWI29_021312 [Acer saccharum]
MEKYLTWSSFFRKDVNSTKSTSCSFDFDFFVLLGIGSVYRLSRYLNRFRPLCLSRSLYSTCGSASGLDASFNADGDGDGDGDGDEDNEDQENDDKDNDNLVLLLPLSISGLLLFGFAISHGAQFRRLGLCVTVSLRQRQRQRGFGLGLHVTYGRNARYFGSGTAGKRGNFQSQGGKNGSGMKHGNGPLSQEQHGVDMAGSNEGNNVGVSKVSMGVDKKKIGNKPKNGSRFSVLNEEVLEEISVKPSHNDTNRQGKNQSKKVLSEISNRKPPNRNQVSKSSSSYLVENNVNKSYFCKPLKENSNEVLSKKDGKGHIKDSRLLPNDSFHGMEEVIEDSVVLQSLHSEIMDLENSVGREGIKVGEVSSIVEKVILSEASNIEEVASKLKEAMDIALV